MKIVPKVTKLQDRRELDVRWPIDCILKRLDDYEEILILAKKKGDENYSRFSTELKSTFWWLGCLDATQQMIRNECLVEEDE